MAKQKHSQQTWWPLYVLALMMVGLLILAHRLAPSPGWRTFLDIGVVIVGYGLIALWLKTNSTTLLDRLSVSADSRAAKSPQLEMPGPRSSHGQRQFYVNSAPTIIYGGLEHATSALRSNGHHPARTIPSSPGEAVK